MPRRAGAGDLKHRVSIQQNTPTEWSREAAWTDLYTVYARIDPISGTDLVAAQAVHPDITYEVTVRWRADVDANLRIAWTRSGSWFTWSSETRYLDIMNVREQWYAGRRFLVMLCKEGTRKGS